MGKILYGLAVGMDWNWCPKVNVRWAQPCWQQGEIICWGCWAGRVMVGSGAQSIHSYWYRINLSLMGLVLVGFIGAQSIPSHLYHVKLILLGLVLVGFIGAQSIPNHWYPVNLNFLGLVLVGFIRALSCLWRHHEIFSIGSEISVWCCTLSPPTYNWNAPGMI